MENERGRIDLLTPEQMDWCNEHCDFTWFVKDNGKVYCKNECIFFKNKDSIVSFPVKFGDCEYFDCSYCKSLKSLKGTPKKVSKNFYCIACDSLKTLKGAPESVGGNFYCYYCKSLKSLKEVPDEVGMNFNCSVCDSLESLKGMPKNIGKDFVCHECESLKSIDELKNTKIDGKIYHADCPKLEKYEFILDNMNMFRRWQKSEYTADEFLKEWSGYFDAQKYGI